MAHTTTRAQSIRQYAERVGRHHDIYQSGRADITLLVQQLGGEVQISRGEGLLLNVTAESEPRFTVYIPLSSPPPADRMTIARALGHLFLHYVLPESQGKPVVRRVGYADGSLEMKKEARWFAQGLLVPPDAAGALLFLSGNDYGYVAQRYGVDELTLAQALDIGSKILD